MDKGALIYADVSFECEVTVALLEDEDLQFFKVKMKTAFKQYILLFRFKMIFFWAMKN